MDEIKKNAMWMKIPLTRKSKNGKRVPKTRARLLSDIADKRQHMMYIIRLRKLRKRSRSPGFKWTNEHSNLVKNFKNLSAKMRRKGNTGRSLGHMVR